MMDQLSRRSSTI